MAKDTDPVTRAECGLIQKSIGHSLDRMTDAVQDLVHEQRKTREDLVLHLGCHEGKELAADNGARSVARWNAGAGWARAIIAGLVALGVVAAIILSRPDTERIAAQAAREAARAAVAEIRGP